MNISAFSFLEISLAADSVIDDDLHLAGVDPILQGLQFPVRPAFRDEQAICQSLAERCHPVGDRHAGSDPLHAIPGGSFRKLPATAYGLGDRDRTGVFGCAGAGGREVDGTQRLVRRAGVGSAGLGTTLQKAHEPGECRAHLFG